MFEARLNQGRILKQVLDSVKDLVTDANFEADPAEGFKLQAMDSSHVSLVALKLHKDGFEFYRCDRPLTMGMNLANMVRTLSRARLRSFIRDARRPFRRSRGSRDWVKIAASTRDATRRRPRSTSRSMMSFTT
jgi:DNA polymerase III sliding clamp (beta) subunit (PCNA family)